MAQEQGNYAVGKTVYARAFLHYPWNAEIEADEFLKFLERRQNMNYEPQPAPDNSPRMVLARSTQGDVRLEFKVDPTKGISFMLEMYNKKLADLVRRELESLKEGPQVEICQYHH